MNESKYGSSDGKEDYPKVTKRLIDLTNDNCFSVWLGRIIYNYYLDCDEYEDDAENDLQMLLPPSDKRYLEKFKSPAIKKFEFGKDEGYKPYDLMYEDHVFALIPTKNLWEVR